MLPRSDRTAGKTFLSGVLLLTVSTVLVKIIGLLYKIPMLSYLGSDGMGYFNSAYEIYALFCVIATAGLPVALSLMISAAVARGEEDEVPAIYRSALTVFLSVGVLGTAIMIVFAGRFCELIRSENAKYSMLAISPTVFLVCLSSAIRGYFQGYQKMLPTALSQLIEAVGKLVFGLLLASYAVRKGYGSEIAAAFAGLGLTLGTALSTLWLIAEKGRFRHAELPKIVRKSPAFPAKYKEIFKALAILALPMTLGASLTGITKLIDMTMILRRLQFIGYSERAANEAYGSYATLALSVFGLLPALVNSVALPLVPMLSAAIASGDRERQRGMIRASYHLTALFAIPAALGLSAFAGPILKLLFGSDPDAVRVASPLLAYLGVSVFLSCMITATNSVLHAYRVVNRPIVALLVGAVVKSVAAYFLIGNPAIGLFGAPVSTFLCTLTVLLLNFVFASSLCDVPGLAGVFLRPMLASVPAVGLASGLYALLGRVGVTGNGITLLCVASAAFLYLLFSCLFGAVREEELLLLPRGKFVAAILRRFHLLKKAETDRIDRTEEQKIG